MSAETQFGRAFADARVLVTGHTGFKGAWLSHWLLSLGAHVTGYALEPDTTPSLFEALDLAERMDSRIGDIRDADALAAVVDACRPEYVFHLAAQPLVRRSYAEPTYTVAVNVSGTANLLEAVRLTDSVRVVVNVTTDKVYENPESGIPFAETDRLGGHDLYSASKACSEIVSAAYRDSFFSDPDARTEIATARAGNVVGGGDWATDRIVPDIVRALQASEPVVVRNPASVRPWQHVLEPLAGYLMLASRLGSDPQGAPQAVNFGPDLEEQCTVKDVVERAIGIWGQGSYVTPQQSGQPREAGLLLLDTALAREALGWLPVWDFDRTIERTIAWYLAYSEDPSAAGELCDADIRAYIEAWPAT